MNKARKILTFLTIFLFISTILTIIPAADAEIKVPSFEIGDKWRYDIWKKNFNTLENVSVNFDETVTDKKNINIKGKDYLVWEMNTKFTVNPYYANNKKYYKVSDYSQVKTEWYESDYYSYIESSDSMWPIQLSGKKEINRTVTQYDGDTIKNSNNKTIVFEYLGEKTITSDDVGSFECYTVKSYKKGRKDNYTLEYYSPDLSKLVKSISYEEGLMSSSIELIAYKTHMGSAGEIDSEEDDESAFSNLPDYKPYLVIILVVLVFVLVLLFVLYKKFKKNK